MAKQIIGLYSTPWNEYTFWIYSDGTVSKPWNIYTGNVEEEVKYIEEKITELWAVALNSPWKPEDDKISDSFSEFEDGHGFTYKREVLCFERMRGVIYSSKKNKVLADEELNKLFSEIQEKYNPENDYWLKA